MTDEPWWWTADTEDDDHWNSEFGGEDIRALVRERNRLLDLLTAARRERDLAIAHDSQPYPTADAYERVCATLTAERERAEALRKALERLVTFKGNPPGLDTCSEYSGCPVPEARSLLERTVP